MQRIWTSCHCVLLAAAVAFGTRGPAGQPGCLPGANVPAAAALWAQARTSLTAVAPARDGSQPATRRIVYERLLNTNLTNVRSQTVLEKDGTGLDVTLPHRETPEYERLGYGDRPRDGTSEPARFYVPTAEALLDPAFEQSHCLSMHESSAEHPREIALAFSPVPGAHDSLIDIAGAIWIDSASRSLRSIDFQFTNVRTRAGSDDALLGGTLSFETMPNGIVIATRWNLRAPLPSGDGFREEGGAVVSARWEGGSWDAALPRVSGHVVSAGGGMPLGGVVVSVRGTPFRTTSDSSGAFLLPPIVPGTFVIEAVDTDFADFNASSIGSVTVAVDRTRPTSVRFVMPSHGAIIDSLCAGSASAGRSSAPGKGLLTGRVLLPSGAAAPDAAIRARWTEVVGADTLSVHMQGRADPSGAFQLCNMPLAAAVRVSAVRDSLVSRDTAVSVQNDGDIARVLLHLTTAGDPRVEAYRRRFLQVIDDASTLPLPGVEVLDGISGRSVGRTAPDGRVSLASFEEGKTLVRVRKPGYEQRLLVVAVEPSDTLPVTVQLRTVAQLAAVKVTASALLSRRAVASGFETRAKQGWGHFLTPTEMERRWGEPLEMAVASAGLKYRSRGSSVVLMGGRGMGCPVTIYIDGNLFYSHTWRGVDPPDASRMNTGDFTAVEYYPDADGAPAQYSATVAGCGILLLWSRDP